MEVLISYEVLLHKYINLVLPMFRYYYLQTRLTLINTIISGVSARIMLHKEVT